VLAFFTGFGGIAIVYLIMAIVVPEQMQVTQEHAFVKPVGSLERLS
jgi:hypothetical protein